MTIGLGVASISGLRQTGGTVLRLGAVVLNLSWHAECRGREPEMSTYRGLRSLAVCAWVTLGDVSRQRRQPPMSVSRAQRHTASRVFLGAIFASPVLLFVVAVNVEDGEDATVQTDVLHKHVAGAHHLGPEPRAPRKHVRGTCGPRSQWNGQRAVI